MKSRLFKLFVALLILHISQILPAQYLFDIKGYARIRGDLHLYPADDFSSMSIGFAAGAVTEYDTLRNNTMIGTFAGFNNETGSHNTFVGSVTGAQNTVGNSNTFLGANVGHENFIGSLNTYLGSAAGRYKQGSENTCIGAGAGISGTGSNNCFIGAGSGSRSGIGFNNVCLGNLAGHVIKNGADNTLVGYKADLSGSGDYTNATALGSHATVNASNKVRIGNTLIQVIEGQVNFSAGSDRRFKEETTPLHLGLDFIMELNPVSYYRKTSRKTGRELGFIAQEILAVLNKFDRNEIGMVYQSSDGYYYLRYDDLLAPIVKGIQELKLENETLRIRIRDLEMKNSKQSN